MTSNCSGKRGKKCFNKSKLDFIKGEVLKFWPVENKESEVDAWKECKKAIDGGGRAINFKLKKQTALEEISNQDQL